MEIVELIKLRDYVCAELVTDSKIKKAQKLIDALIQIPIRDAVLRHLHDNAGARNQTAINLEKLLNKCVSHEAAALATILAGCYWLDADMDKTKKALSKALKADPTYSLARLLDVALVHGVPPKVWADSLAAVSPEQCLSGAA